ncbi:hypothetical protein ACHAXM_001582 [Skeletonema potamos]
MPSHADDRKLPEVYLSKNSRRKSITNMFQPEEDVRSDADLYTHATSDLQMLHNMFAPFRPASKRDATKTHTQGLDDDALFAYIEKRSVPHGEYDRRRSSSSGFSISSLFDVSDDAEEKSHCGSLASLFGNIGRNVAPDSAEESPFQVAVRNCSSTRGNAVYRRGKKAADSGEWEKAVYYYHIALVKQRSYYGEDHINTAETLNCLGLALLELEEFFGAITALEECLHIRQNLLGPGAEECAETTTNICRVLDGYHKQNGK